MMEIKTQRFSQVFMVFLFYLRPRSTWAQGQLWPPLVVPLPAPLNLIQQAKGIGRTISALPNKELVVYLDLRFNLIF